jgi:hypothetical protein
MRIIKVCFKAGISIFSGKATAISPEPGAGPEEDEGNVDAAAVMDLGWTELSPVQKKAARALGWKPARCVRWSSSTLAAIVSQRARGAGRHRAAKRDCLRVI